MKTTDRRWVYYFGDALPYGCSDPKALLGGKGAGLSDMSRSGLAVPHGFTIETECCAKYFELGRRWPDGLEEQVRENLKRLERDTGREFGRGRRPLLVSVRSGAAVSMPGMMDTVLNCGLHPGLAADVGDTPEFWDLYIRFICAFCGIVHRLDVASLDHARVDREDEPVSRELAEAYLSAYSDQTGVPFPVDPWESLVQCINAVFASWLSDRAVAYRERNDIRGLNGTAVNVQAMFPSEVSGVVFTADPSSPASNRMVIEASYGLGEAIVSGDVTPDRFLVNRDDLSLRTELGRKHRMLRALGARGDFDPDAPSLNPAQVRELAELALKIEGHFGHPVDIEFGMADGKFAVLQSRAIRGLDIAGDVEIGRQEEVFRLRGMSDSRHRCWVMHNLDETLRYPTPFTWDVVRRFMSGGGGFGKMYRDFGYCPSERVSREGFLDLICGRIYADPERLAELFWDAMPLTYDIDALVADRSLLDRAPTKFDPDRADSRFLLRLPASLWGMMRASRNMRRSRAGVRERFERTVLPAFLQYVDRERNRDLTALSDQQVIAELRERCAKVLDEFGPESLKPGFFGATAYDSLTGLLAQILGPDHGGEVARTLTRALDGDTTFQQDAMLYDVALGKAGMETFLDRFGHRCVGEMELANARWRENPSYLHQIVRRIRDVPGRTPHLIHEENLARRVEAEKQLPHLLAKHGGSVFREQVERELADAQALLPYRESGKHYLMMGYELIRLAAQELAGRWDLGTLFYFLRLEELEALRTDREALARQLAGRKIRHQAFQRLDMPDVIDSRNIESLGLAAELAAVSEVQGLAVASGVAVGTARVVFDPQTAGDLGRDYILVCPSTDPGWTPLFLQARGLVVERGGVLSHGAIVARDFGIPAMVCPNATRLVNSGDRIRVDGNKGCLAIVERHTEGKGNSA